MERDERKAADRDETGTGPGDGRLPPVRRSRFVELLRATPVDTVCPNFYLLAHANGCSFSPACDYCFLKSSLWFLEAPRAYANTGALLDEVSRWIARDGLESTVLNAGNLSDSLCFERERPLAASLVELFRREAEARGRPHTLLLVTKAGREHCEALLGVEPCRNVVVSFSLSAPEAALRFERGAAALPARLAAARALREHGCRVRVRIDPMIAGYSHAGIASEARRLSPERVTLGTLRAEPNLLRHVDRGLFAGLEPPKHPGGLHRYARETRLALYREALEELRGVAEVALCEETPEMWSALGLDLAARRCNCAP